MARLRKFLVHVFDVLAVLFGLMTVGTIAAMIAVARRGMPAMHSHYPVYRSGPTTALAGAISASIAVVYFSLPLLLSICYGIAAWKLRRGSASARRWAIGASIALLVQSVPLAAATYFVLRYSTGGAGGLVTITLVFAALGIAGLVAFCPCQSPTDTVVKKPQRIPSDGTSRWADAVAWIVGVVGYFIVATWLYRWAYAHGLRDTHGLNFWVILLAALLISTAFHEAGHAIAGILLGMKLRMFVVGPFQWQIREGRWHFTFDVKKVLAAGGATACVPTTPEWPIGDEICFIAAGPAASFATGLFGAVLLLGCKGTWYEQNWNFLVLLTAISLVSGLVNLLPLQPDAIYSDGAQIYQLIKGGPWADLHRVEAMVTSTLATPMRPRDWDLQAIHKAEESFSDGRRAMMLRLFESSYYLDRGGFDEARRAFVEAEALYPSAEDSVLAGMLTSFVYRSAVLSRDAKAARGWWDRMESAKTVYKGFNYWLAMSALRWVEGDARDAQSLLNRADALASSLPKVGDSDFDLYRCELLRREIEAAATAPKSEIAHESQGTRTGSELMAAYAVVD